MTFIETLPWSMKRELRQALKDLVGKIIHGQFVTVTVVTIKKRGGASLNIIL